MFFNKFKYAHFYKFFSSKLIKNEKKTKKELFDIKILDVLILFLRLSIKKKNV